MWKTGAIVTTSRVFVIVAGLVAAGTFVFSLLSEYKRSNENDIRAWQKTIIYKIVADSDLGSANFNEIKVRYVAEAAAHQQFDVPKEELNDTVTRRILLELVSDGALRLADQGYYSINISGDISDRYETLLQEHLRVHTASLDAIRRQELSELQRAIIFEIIVTATSGSIGFSDIQKEYASKSAEYDEDELPKDQLNENETRRVILGLIADNAVVSIESDKYSVNNLPAKYGEFMTEISLAEIKSRSAFEEQMAGQRKALNHIVQLVDDNPGGYTQATLLRALMRKDSLTKAEALLAMHGAFMQGLLAVDHRDEKGRIHLRMDMPR